jgi:hypothetical protein
MSVGIVPMGDLSAVVAGGWDCFCADLALDPTVDPDPTLASIYAALPEGGALVASISNAGGNSHRNGRRKRRGSAVRDVSASLAAVGFVDVDVANPGISLLQGTLPYPWWRDGTVHIRGWKRSPKRSELERIDELARFIYDALVPAHPGFCDDAIAILGRGTGLCGDYAVALGEALRREGFHLGFVSMLAEGHPGGRGRRMVETHEVLEITLTDGTRHVIDPMANVRFPSSFSRLVNEPSLADIDRVRDERYRSRGYDLYSTSFWYSRVVKADIRVSPRDPRFFVPVKSLRQSTRWSEMVWAPRRRPIRRVGRTAVRRLRSRLLQTAR